MFLFLVWGFNLILGEIPREWSSYTLGFHYQMPGWLLAFRVGAPIFIIPIFLCVGWIKGFPRWSYPYVVHVVVFSWYMTNVSTPGFSFFGFEMFGRQTWGQRAWMPLFVVAVIALVLTRSYRPIIKFFTNIWEDWTLLTFGMFGLMPFIVFIMFDEVDRMFSLYFMVILAVLILWTTYSYLRSDTHTKRTRSLLIGVSLTLGIVSIAPNIYWLSIMDVNIIPALVVGVVAFLFMFSPSLLLLGRRKAAI